MRCVRRDTVSACQGVARDGTELESIREMIARTRSSLFSECRMLMTIAIILIVLWLLGMVSAYTMGGAIHILLVVAIIVILVRVVQGRRPL